MGDPPYTLFIETPSGRLESPPVDTLEDMHWVWRARD